MSKIAVYPGTFDPITNGHADIIHRAAKYLCDKLIVSVALNESKKPVFSLEERIELCKTVVNTLPTDIAKKIEIVPFRGLLIHHAQASGANLLVRGLRAVSDFEYEFKMAGMNARITDDIETVFLVSSETNQFISSNMVKEVYFLGGDVSSCVHPLVMDRFYKNFPQ